ncbi:MAG: hypothetical protein JWP01_2200 [Myxococcales bacterium]|nr:hypothetical protein [Myxococcales bacterium]
MSPLKTSLLIAILACVSACGRQVVEFKTGDESDAGVDAAIDARDSGTDGPLTDGPLTDGPLLDGPVAIPPVVLSTVPAPGATFVALNTLITATFSKPMNPATISMTTFTLRQGATALVGTVMLDAAGTTARFTPMLPLTPNLVYTATITTGAQDTTAMALVAPHIWMFTTAANAMPPTVISVTPLDGAINISLNVSPTATFSKAMNAATINSQTFMLSQGATPIAGVVTLDPVTNTATFNPMNPLISGLVYTATVNTGAQDTGGMALQMSRTWMFTTSMCAQVGITLGAAGNFAVLAGSTVTNTGLTTVTGDLGVSPGTAVTGFPPGILVGMQHTNTTSATAIANLTTAYDEAAGRTLCPVSVAGNLGGMTLAPGLYKSTSSLEITSGDLTLDAMGDPDAVWVFQVASTLTTTIGRQVILAGGAQSRNIYWQVGTSATLGVTSVFHGTIMADQAITLNTGAVLNGRALARIAAVALAGNTVVRP